MAPRTERAEAHSQARDDEEEDRGGPAGQGDQGREGEADFSNI